MGREDLVRIADAAGISYVGLEEDDLHFKLLALSAPK
jgi:hypothetical protein